MRYFFLLNLRTYGIKNIEEPVEFSFYKKTINKNFNPENYKIKGIYGENGSGKTAVVTAVKILRSLIFDKDYLYDSITQRNLSELINKKTKAGLIEVEFMSNAEGQEDIFHYRIGFGTGKEDRISISNELLEVKKGTASKNIYKKIYETQNGDLIYFGDETHYPYFKDETQNLLTQRSFASFVMDFITQENKKRIGIELLRVLTLYVFSLSLNVFLDQADDHRNYIHQVLISELDERKLEESVEIINAAREAEINASRERIIPKNYYDKYHKNVSRLCAFIQLFKPDLQNIQIDAKDFGEYYQCRLVMVYKDYTIDSEYESNGIKKLMNLFNYLDSACSGAITFIDEMDSNINDIYLNKIIEYFIEYGEGQLCFTAHNLSPMAILKKNKLSISFLSSINTVHTWTSNGNQTPENAYKDGFIEDSPFNVDASDFLGILGEDNE